MSAVFIPGLKPDNNRAPGGTSQYPSPAPCPHEHRAVTAILNQAGWPAARYRLDALRPDGSGRRFVRIHRPSGGQGAVAALPPRLRTDTENACCAPCTPSPVLARHRAEARSTWLLGRHLMACRAPVPRLLGHDAATGVVVFADLGDLRLHDLATEAHASGDWTRAVALYRHSVEQLAHMQVRAAKDWTRPGAGTPLRTTWI